MLRVVHVGKYYPPVPGGMERVLQMLCTATRGHLDSEVIAFSRDRATTRDVVDGVPVTRVGTLGEAGSVPVGLGLAGALRAARADVMILHEPNPSALVALLAARPPIPLGIWFHSDVIRPALQFRLFYDPVATPIYRRARRFAVSSAALADSSPMLKPYRDRVSVIPFAIDADEWQCTPECTARAAARRGADGRPIVLFVGRLVPYKGVDVLLRAAGSLPVRVVIAGDGPERARLERIAATAANPAAVEFVGSISDGDLKAWMHAATALALPSVTRAEAFGFVQLEAMAAGVPVVSTGVATGVPWVNQHGVTGLVVPPGDVVALRAALHRIITEPGLAAQFGTAGRERVRTVFDVPTMIRRIVEFCEQVARS